MTNILVSLFKETPSDVIDKVVYLIQGRLYPEYVGIELGIAEKLLLRAISISSGINLGTIEKYYSELGDPGLVAEKALSQKKMGDLLGFLGGVVEKVTVKEVYNMLDKIAKYTGPGSIDYKVRSLVGLFNRMDAKEAKYLARIIVGKLRLGVADMTVLDALAILYGGSKDVRDVIERAYNLRSDLGEIARTLETEGIDGVKKIGILIGRPIRPMLAERLASPQEILNKLGGLCAAEYKYDGERIQAHKKGEEVVLFSRKLENITHHYPDVVELIRRHILADEAIVEAEAVAIDPDTGEMLPFQELMHRRRKYGIEEAIKKYPVSLFFFDVLYVDGNDLTLKPYPERREMLEKIIKPSDRVMLARQKVVKSIEELEEFFEEAVESGCEGLMCKSLAKASIYQAGNRGFLWIKLKRSYQSKMVEPVDLVVVGAFYGKGRRAGTYGVLLGAVYDPKEDVFKTVCKVGSGFTDEDLAKLPELLEPYKIPHKHPRVVSKMTADVWFVPSVVIEVIGDEITLSPIHTAGMDRIKEGSGLGIRFPRFTGRYRFDKKPEDATTEDEIIEMYLSQIKKISEV